MLIALIAVLLLLVYAVIAVMIVYHLQTYTIDRRFTQRTIIAFLVITTLLVCLQIAALLFVLRGMSDDDDISRPVFGQVLQ